MARIDHNVNAKQRAYARWSTSDFVQVRTANAIPGIGGDHRDGGKYSNGGVVDWVNTLNSTTMLNIRAALSYWVEKIGPPDYGFDATQWGWPASMVNQLTKRDLLPSISVSGATTLGNASSNITLEPTTVFSLQPNIALMRGTHTIKVGLDYRVTRYTQYRPSADRASLELRPGFHACRLPGAGRASAATAPRRSCWVIPDSGSAGFTANPFFQWIYYAPWIQDDCEAHAQARPESRAAVGFHARRSRNASTG